jgi:hypothetical protein
VVWARSVPGGVAGLDAGVGPLLPTLNVSARPSTVAVTPSGRRVVSRPVRTSIARTVSKALPSPSRT